MITTEDLIQQFLNATDYDQYDQFVTSIKGKTQEELKALKHAKTGESLLSYAVKQTVLTDIQKSIYKLYFVLLGDQILEEDKAQDHYLIACRTNNTQMIPLLSHAYNELSNDDKYKNKKELVLKRITDANAAKPRAPKLAPLEPLPPPPPETIDTFKQPIIAAFNQENLEAYQKAVERLKTFCQNNTQHSFETELKNISDNGTTLFEKALSKKALSADQKTFYTAYFVSVGRTLIEATEGADHLILASIDRNANKMNLLLPAYNNLKQDQSYEKRVIVSSRIEQAKANYRSTHTEFESELSSTWATTVEKAAHELDPLHFKKDTLIGMGVGCLLAITIITLAYTLADDTMRDGFYNMFKHMHDDFHPADGDTPGNTSVKLGARVGFFCVLTAGAAVVGGVLGGPVRRKLGG